jgi:acyl carrier protein
MYKTMTGGVNKLEEILTKVQQAFHDAFDIDPKLVSMETAPDDIPGWDSVGHLALASSLESNFGVSLDVDDLMEMENVREIVRILQSKLKKA